jgi:hypothetical protein
MVILVENIFQPPISGSPIKTIDSHHQPKGKTNDELIHL